MAEKGKEKARRETLSVNLRTCCSCKREFLAAVPPGDQYFLLKAESISSVVELKEKSGGPKRAPQDLDVTFLIIYPLDVGGNGRLHISLNQ